MRFLFVDRILQLTPGEVIRGVKHITREDTYLCPDDSNRLCFAPSLIGETLGQLAAWNVMAFNDFTLRPVAGVVASARLHRSVYIGETLELESFIERLDESAVLYNSVARVGDEVVFNIDGALGPLLPMTEFIDEKEVRQQFSEINRPGEWPVKTTSVNLKNVLERVDNCSTMPTCRGLSTASMDPANKSRDVGLEMTCQQTLWDEAARPLPVFSFDRIVASEPGVSLSAEKRITRAAPYFPDHFPKKPVLPMTVLLECKLNLAREFIARAPFSIDYTVSELRKIKMTDFIQPGDIILCDLKVKEQNEQQLILNYRSEVNGKRVCILDVVMTARKG
ncbi:(3R)-hydroxymyristoyl-ACP dehydratase [Legionella lansingensis]|uniref:(3R)-hydroxymyristoyl-ACP dehydratase n=1 Tax=Legionella lansingensis TaxID=45067 RepID=A0A0W0VGJ5_9GAMM|nr:hydroxymyristoyl-ACP dehydratase [Legionella lansingensis]KTD19163.1 (3R)-hydroxymyristoyl-ACP dehydratase [Legionella lansingensis]SNV45365.1 (3R)-hydroxymyristoyl-ACP dehydratase [Legionella lansingensis]